MPAGAGRSSWQVRQRSSNASLDTAQFVPPSGALPASRQPTRPGSHHPASEEIASRRSRAPHELHVGHCQPERGVYQLGNLAFQPVGFMGQPEAGRLTRRVRRSAASPPPRSAVPLPACLLHFGRQVVGAKTLQRLELLRWLIDAKLHPQPGEEVHRPACCSAVRATSRRTAVSTPARASSRAEKGTGPVDFYDEREAPTPRGQSNRERCTCPSSAPCFGRFRGRPNGRSVCSSPLRRAVVATPSASPYGCPRFTLRRSACNSASVCASFTRATQSSGIGARPRR